MTKEAGTTGTVNAMSQVTGILSQLSLKELTTLTRLAQSELHLKQSIPLMSLMRLLAAMPTLLVFRPQAQHSLTLGLNKVGARNNEKREPSDIGDITEVVVTCLDASGWEWKLEHSQLAGMKVYSKILMRPMPDWLASIGVEMAEAVQDSMSGGDLYDILRQQFSIKNPPKKQDSILPEDPVGDEIVSE